MQTFSYPVGIKSRLAPTPSGYLHEGNVYNFILTYLLVINAGGSLHLRIDDADNERIREEYVEDIFNVLHWLGISYDTGPKDSADFNQHYSQQLKRTLYDGIVKQLDDKGLLFKCNCSRKALANSMQIHKQCLAGIYNADEPYALRLNTLKLEEYLAGKFSFNIHSKIPYPVVRKKDGFAAYSICSIADDVEQDINLIVRGADLYDQTMLQIAIAKVLGFQTFTKANYIHHALLLDDSGNKISKSAGRQKQSIIKKYGSIKPLLAVLPFEYKTTHRPKDLQQLLSMYQTGELQPAIVNTQQMT